MSESKKRKAIDQLSPYSPNDEVEKNNNAEKPQLQPKDRSKKRARVGFDKSKGVIADTSSLKGIIPSISIFSKNQPEDKVSGLNKCFLAAITKVVNKQSNKDLRDIFKQYESYIDSIKALEDN